MSSFQGNHEQSTETTSGKSSFEDALDRMASFGGTVATSAVGSLDSTLEFLPSATWQGAKPGFYFGTGREGTGYYRDHQHPINGTSPSDDQVEPSKRKRKAVQIAEDQNEMRFLPSSANNNNSNNVKDGTILLEQAEQQARGMTVMELTPKGLKSATNALERIVTQNSMQRAQHANDPQQYMASELQLYEQITSLQAVAANLDLYQHLVDNETLLSILVQLLGHENADIAASVIALFYEWVDPSLFTSDEAATQPKLVPTISQLTRRIIIDAWDTIAANLARFQPQGISNGGGSGGDDDDDENDTEDQTLRGVDNVLNLMENILEVDLVGGGLFVQGGHPNDKEQSAAAYMVQQESNIISWLFQQLQNQFKDSRNKDTGDDSSSEDLYARCMELLAFVAQREDVHSILPDWSQIQPYKSPFLPMGNVTNGTSSTSTTSEKANVGKNMDGMELLLQAIGRYRKTQPANDKQVEYLENACIVVSSCLTFSTRNVSAFLAGQGIELVLRCLKECVHAGGSTLKLLDYFGPDQIHKGACEHFVQAGGFKYLFPIFLGTRIPKPAPVPSNTSKKAKREWLHMVETQTIRILYNLSRHLDDESPDDAKARWIAKFVTDPDKCDRLVELILSYDEKARRAEYHFFYKSDVDDTVQDETTVELAALDAKLKGGGEIFHRLGAIAACLCVHSKRCHERILSQLQLQQSGISVVKAALEEFVSVLGPGRQREQLESYLLQI